jgi:hypothetical protein
MVVCVRNYRASRHNQIVNAHREGALTTFAAFRESAEGAAGDAVLLQATEAVFSSQPTGYTEGDGSPTHVNELLRLVREKDKG